MSQKTSHDVLHIKMSMAEAGEKLKPQPLTQTLLSSLIPKDLNKVPWTGEKNQNPVYFQ